jgi:NADP-dependent 3-hydroxy acid dehydrogenase YdfG
MSSKIWLITGGTSGIGAATAMMAVEKGDKVFITGRSSKRLQAVLEAIGKPDQVSGMVADAASWEDNQTAVRKAVEQFSMIDIVFANAGFTATGDFKTGDPAIWKDMVLTNVYGAGLLVKASLPELEKTRGHILLTGSVAGRKHIPGSMYSVTKWAVAGMAENLRLQVAKHGIRVTLISPGRVETPFWPQLPNAPMLTAEDVAQAAFWATRQPAHVDVNEILIRPLGQDV